MAIALSSRHIIIILPYVFMIYLYCYVLVLHESVSKLVLEKQSVDLALRLRGQLTRPSKSIARSLESSKQYQGWGDRLGNLESKLNSYLGFSSDPFLWSRRQVSCNLATFLTEHRVVDDGEELIMPVCLDNFRHNNCTVYDFGIRAQPSFGLILSKPPFNCQVYAFDPSDVTKLWYANNTEMQQNPNYHMFHYGGGGADENITLREYNWNQVTIYSYPKMVVKENPRNCTGGACRYQRFTFQKEFQFPVRSVASIMKELGHDRIDVLKLDVEGSEYRMLEGLIDSGVCDHIDQLTLEWHHYGYDTRYGPGSVPHLNVFVKLLNEKCSLSQFYIRDTVGWPANDEQFLDMKLTMMYNIASFKSDKKK